MSEITQDARPLSDHDARQWAALLHVAGIFFFFLPALICYTLVTERGPYIRQQARSALNFQLTVLVGYVAGFFSLWFLVGIFVLIGVAVVHVVFSILAALEAHKGADWNFPLSVPFVTK
jgi:uncharacterized Tic20 family protein